MLPYDESKPPEIVVHLREPDTERDKRAGLDHASLEALGILIHKESTANNLQVYLVTNNVEYHKRFETDYGWRHPNWKVVKHSAMNIVWGKSKEKDDKVDKIHDVQQQTMQMWSDWYTILTAKKVYHTFSDFSTSAVHWQSIPSRIFGGLDENGKLKLGMEIHIHDGPTEPLVDRSLSANGTAKLQRCDSP
mmetsp:Transcript_806/g.962  ORF Transcript_806/g.962 Transcript_806/m.962 type:complete len:191 (-) Transcript_806:300-872(-)